MKLNIAVFKILAAIIAIGGAFASVSANPALVVTTAYVRYTTATDAAVIQYCTVAGICDTQTGGTCIITVSIAGTPSNVRGKKLTSANMCSVIQTDNDSVPDGPKTLPPTAFVINP